MSIVDYLLSPNALGTYFCTYEVATEEIMGLLKETAKFDSANNRQPDR